MSEELSDKEIRDLVDRTSIGCPNCGGRLALAVNTGLSDSDSLALMRLLEAGQLRLHPVEDALEDAKSRGVNSAAKEFMQ